LIARLAGDWSHDHESKAGNQIAKRRGKELNHRSEISAMSSLTDIDSKPRARDSARPEGSQFGGTRSDLRRLW
jgi:hypothetical protein